jgi:hypothetical protein
MGQRAGKGEKSSLWAGLTGSRKLANAPASAPPLQAPDATPVFNALFAGQSATTSEAAPEHKSGPTAPTLQPPANAKAVPTEPDSLVVDAETNNVIKSWAARELSPWRLCQTPYETYTRAIDQLNLSEESLFKFTLRSGGCDVADKPNHPVRAASIARRVDFYLQFFNFVTTALPPEFTATIALGVADKVPFVPEVPIFSFQKKRGNKTILLPDIDFMIFDYYRSGATHDTIEYEDKSDKAIFVGGTSGGQISPNVARACSLPRLRAARFFWEHPKIEFLLPAIVQTTNDEAREVLQNLPFCGVPRITWQEQFKCRYIISMDGNGATCSRVAIALRSNSVLLKYDSEEVLYYFHAMQPWLHYIPISRDEDVETCLRMVEWSPDLPRMIAAEGRRFAQRYLTMEAVVAYARELLSLFPGCFS